MAEVVASIEELKLLPDEVHWFCPRVGPTDQTCYFDEDLAGKSLNPNNPDKACRDRGIAEAKARKVLVLDALRILAFDGHDAAPYQAWLKEQLDRKMALCDVCVREYHRGRRDLKHGLEEQYDEEAVSQFLEKLDNMNLQRITQGLDHAAQTLNEVAPEERGISALDETGLFAIFESLNCNEVLSNEDLLRQHFEEPFRLVQTRRPLKLGNYTLAMTIFLFGLSEERSTWALITWARFKRNLTSAEFEWTVRDTLSEMMKRVHISSLDLELLPRFWLAVKVIVGRLDQDLITHSLRAMDTDICRLALDHLQLDFAGFSDLLGTLQLLLEKAPNDFWDAMGTISPATVIEQVFASPSMQHLLSGGEQDSNEGQMYEDALDWTHPLLASVKANNQTSACRALLNQLMIRMQADKYSREVRSYCWKAGLKTLVQTLGNLMQGNSTTAFVGAAIVSDILDVVGRHIQRILPDTEVSSHSQSVSEISMLSLEVVRLALALDCRSLAVDRETLAHGKAVQHESSMSSLVIWKAVVKAVGARSICLASKALVGIRGLTSLERLTMELGNHLAKDTEHFNNTLDRFSRYACDIFERLSDFNPDNLDPLFEVRESASAIIAALFSPNPELRQGALELLKVVSSQNGRQEAIAHILTAFYANTLSSFSSTVRQIAQRRVFGPNSNMLKLCTDLLESLCNSQDGVLRSRALSPEDAQVTEDFWQSLWQALNVIFEQMEFWSNVGYHKDKDSLKDFCRDTMQFADKAFDQYSIIASSLQGSDASRAEKASGSSRRLLQYPTATMNGIFKWLRLRDEYLVDKSVTLVSKMLGRLQEAGIKVAESSLKYLESIITHNVKTNLSPNHAAELQRAWELQTGHAITVPTPASKQVSGSRKQGSISTWATSSVKPQATQAKKKGVIDLDDWHSAARQRKTADEDIQEEMNKLISDASSTAERFKAQRAARDAGRFAVAVAKKAPQKQVVDPLDFRRKREEEREAKKKRDALAVAQAKKSLPLRGVAAQTAEAGSGLAGIGVAGKDHAVKGAGMMVSSGESSDDDDDDSEDELDRELFGGKVTTKKLPKTLDTSGTIGLKSEERAPVKLRRQIRSAKDMRARLAPDLSPLHKEILSWDFFHEGDYPPNSRQEMYNAVSNKFRTPVDYQNTFRPLLTLEAWQGFVKSREENSSRPYEVKVVNRSSVDAFIEVSSTMSHADNKEVSISEGDIILLSRAAKPTSAPTEPHCLARVYRITRKKNWLEVLYRITPGNGLVPSLVPNAALHGTKIQSITPLEREYGALLGLQYYDLCEEIIKARPSPLLNYTDKQLEPFIGNYNVNKAQAKAVKSAIDNDAFTLIQGPPGSGKTKTIVAIVGALLTDSLHDRGTVIERPKNTNGMNGTYDRTHQPPPPKKLLICAPSNAAVDELVMRFKEGVKTTAGHHHKISVVRLGRSDAMNANVMDVTLDELVNKILNKGSEKGPNAREETQKIMKEHQAISEKLRLMRDKLDAGEAKGKEAVVLKEEFDAIRRRKAQLGTAIDAARDNENVASRQADLNRKRAQQSVIDDAHVICATLSGSGHDMFQNLNIEFETVVVDEAAQCVEMSALIPLKYGCAKCILVGDPKQLPPTVFSKEAARFQYEQSLFVRMQANHPDDVHLLDTQYRMHPEISAFPSRTFYDGRLLDGGDMAALRKRPWHTSTLLSPYRFFDVQGQHQAAPKGHSLINLAEIDVAMHLFERLTKDTKNYDFTNRIGVITPYKSQLRELKDRFARRFGQGIFETVEFNTTDAFQGRESEIIIFSCVRASPAGGIGFLQDIRRMNVGLTRAKSSLWVLGNSQSLVRGEFWRKLVEDAQARSRYTTGDLIGMLQKAAPVSLPATAKNGGNGKQETTRAPSRRPDGVPRRPSASDAILNGNKVKSERNLPAPSSTAMEGVKRKLEDMLPKKESRATMRQEGPAKVVPRKRSYSSDEDVEMKDAPSPAESMLEGEDTASNLSKIESIKGITNDKSLKAKPEPADKKPSILQAGVPPMPAPRTGAPTSAPLRPPKRRRPAADPFMPKQPHRPKPT
ncbi:tRNA-splicing endonuclease-like protein [Cryomyces antarcticus]